MFEYPPGATPLDLDEANGLLARHITTQNQLNEWEQINILAAEKWVNRQQFKAEATTNLPSNYISACLITHGAGLGNFVAAIKTLALTGKQYLSSLKCCSTTCATNLKIEAMRSTS